MISERHGEDMNLIFENDEFGLVVDAARHRMFKDLDAGLAPHVFDAVLADSERDVPRHISLRKTNLPYLPTLLRGYAADQRLVFEEASQAATNLAVEIEVQNFVDDMNQALPQF